MANLFSWLWEESEEDKDTGAIKQLKADWVQDNSDAREQDVTRKHLEKRIEAAEEAVDGLKQPTKLLDLAEAYGILNPRDDRCLKTCELLMQIALAFLTRQRQGDAHHLHARCLFLRSRFDETLRALLRAQDCYKEQGTKRLRRQNNVCLARVYSALGKYQDAHQRIDVALTQCEKKDDGIAVYISGKTALENTEFEDEFVSSWENHLEENPETKTYYQNFFGSSDGTVKQLMKQHASTREDEVQAPETLKDWVKLAKQYKIITGLVGLFIVCYLIFTVWIARYLSRVIVSRVFDKS